MNGQDLAVRTLPGFAAPAVPPDTRKHDPANRSFQYPLRLRQGIVQTSAILQFGFIWRLAPHQGSSGFTAIASHHVHLEGNPRCSADWQRHVSVGFSHKYRLPGTALRGIQTTADSAISVCPTDTP
jgi:hypothetical protein